MNKTKIEWVRNPDGSQGYTWNPVVGCTPISEGCRNCYAKRIFERFNPGKKFSSIVPDKDKLYEPFKIRKSSHIFVNSMSDLFHPDVPFDFVDAVYATMLRSVNHTYMILTKRPDRMLEYYESDGLYERVLKKAYKLDCKILTSDENIGDGISDPRKYPSVNIWLGVSIEDQKTADERVPYILQTPASVRFVSVEPMLENIILRGFDGKIYRPWLDSIAWKVEIDWIICGGETGLGSRPMHPDWVRGLRDQCISANVPFFFKSWGAYLPSLVGCVDDDKNPIRISTDGHFWKGEDLVSWRVGGNRSGRLLDKREWNEMPNMAPER